MIEAKVLIGSKLDRFSKQIYVSNRDLASE